MAPVPASPADPVCGLPYAWGAPAASGRLRTVPEDFAVEELLGYEASGDGEHAFLRLRKRDLNTHDVARRIARLARVPQVKVGYAGLKDRHAVAIQHFSVQLPGQGDPDWTRLEDEGGIEILAVSRHQRKIKRGGLKGNRFRLRIRGLESSEADWSQRLRTIADHGVPNYFGPQRFGFGGKNLLRIDPLFAGEIRAGREQRGLLLSAARAHLFNQVLAERVRRGNWDAGLDGDVMLLAGTRRQFMAENLDDELVARLAEGDIHPTGPLPGRQSRSLEPTGTAAEIEHSVLAAHGAWVEGLARQGLDRDRRALRLEVRNLHWEHASDTLELAFELIAGAYATMVVRELLHDRSQAADR